MLPIKLHKRIRVEKSAEGRTGHDPWRRHDELHAPCPREDEIEEALPSATGHREKSTLFQFWSRVSTIDDESLFLP